MRALALGIAMLTTLAVLATGIGVIAVNVPRDPIALALGTEERKLPVVDTTASGVAPSTPSPDRIVALAEARAAVQAAAAQQAALARKPKRLGAVNTVYIRRYASLWSSLRTAVKRQGDTQKSLDDAIVALTRSRSVETAARALRDQAQQDYARQMQSRSLTVDGTDVPDPARVAWEAAAARHSAVRDRMKTAQDKVDALEKKLKKRTAAVKKAERGMSRVVRVKDAQRIVGTEGCPTTAPGGTVPSGVNLSELCEQTVAKAATPQAGAAIKWALAQLGSTYACQGIGRMAEDRFDCSSFVARSYAQGSGLDTATKTWSPTTRDMVPWDGADLDPHFVPIEDRDLAPGDLVLYETCQEPVCISQHVAMYLGRIEGRQLMIHTNRCGGEVHIVPFWGTGEDVHYLGARRVMPRPGETVSEPKTIE